MACSSRILAILSKADSAAADQAMAAALAHASPDTFAAVVLVLLDRGQPDGFRALIEYYHLLPPEQQQAVEHAGQNMLAAVQEIIRSAPSQAQVNALAILKRTGQPRLASLAADALTNQSTAVKQAAGETIRTLVEALLKQEDESVAQLRRDWDALTGGKRRHDAKRSDNPPRRDGPQNDAASAGAAPRNVPAGMLAWQRRCAQVMSARREDRRDVVVALTRAMESFVTHLRTEVLEAAMFLADDLGPVLLGGTGSRRGSLAHAMLEILARSKDPRLAAFMCRAVGQPDIRSRVIALFMAKRDTAFLQALIRERWRCRIEQTRKALCSVHTLRWLDPGVAPLLGLPEHAHAAAVSWISGLGLSEDALCETLRGVLDFDSREASIQAVWELVHRHTPQTTTVLRGLVETEDADVRRIARFEVSGRGRLESLRSRHGGRKLQCNELLRRLRLEPTFASLWEAADHLADVLRGVNGADILAGIPEFDSSLREKLCSVHAQDHIRAFRLITAFGLENQFAAELFRQADHADGLVRGETARLLGRTGGATSRRILERLLGDSDPIVRCHAIEALSTVAGDRSIPHLLERLLDDVPQVRMATIRALLRRRVPQAAEAMVQALRDSRAAHRLAALAAVAQLRLTPLAARLADMAQSDPDEQVRQRAKRIRAAFARLIPAENNVAAAEAKEAAHAP